MQDLHHITGVTTHSEKDMKQKIRPLWMFSNLARSVEYIRQASTIPLEVEPP